MRDPTEYDLALADRVTELSPDAIAISTTGPQPESVRREMIARAARAQRLAFEQARVCVAAIPVTERRSRFYQPFAGAVILRDGAPWWGMFYAGGVYLANAETSRLAQHELIETDHCQALRENDYRDRRALCLAVAEKGRSTLAESMRRVSRDATQI